VIARKPTATAADDLFATVCAATYTPEFGGPGHGSILCAGDTAAVLSEYAKGLRAIGGIQVNELYGGG
jgi:hypothetical protein